MGLTGKDLLFFLVLFLANIIQAITGFAGTLLAMPFSIRLLGVDEAKALLNLFTLLACLGVAVQGWRYIRWKELGRILLGMAVGMAAGMWMFQTLPLPFLLRGYGVLIVAVALKNMLRPGRARLPGWALWLVLLAAGVIHGMFVSGGALLVVYATLRLEEKDEFRATMASVWVVLNSVLAVSFGASGAYTPGTLWRLAVGMIPLGLALWAGARLYTRIDQVKFARLNNFLLLISGVSVLF
ncbi:MAG: sulfite exporter TauE/SafE family protein [Oscillospiraceae bacterium]|nr:sulfite exporter TauE/SafE family protein [Oscillospiraceae bacterium]